MNNNKLRCYRIDGSASPEMLRLAVEYVGAGRDITRIEQSLCLDQLEDDFARELDAARKTIIAEQKNVLLLLSTLVGLEVHDLEVSHG